MGRMGGRAPTTSTARPRLLFPVRPSRFRTLIRLDLPRQLSEARAGGTWATAPLGAIA